MRSACKAGVILFAVLLFGSISVHGGVTLSRISPLNLYPDNRVPEELGSVEGPVKARIPPGRLGDVVFALTGHDAKLEDVIVEVSALKTEEGQSFQVPAEYIRTVVCYYGPKGGLSGPDDWDAENNYRYGPFALFYDASLISPDHERHRTEITYEGLPDDQPPLEPRDIPSSEIRQRYITIPVPEDQKPGVYEGEVRFLSGSEKVAAARAREAGATILSYHGPQMIYHNPMLYRLRTGFNLWNNIYDGWFPFAYAWRIEEGHKTEKIVTKGRSGRHKWHGLVLVGENRMIPFVEWRQRLLIQRLVACSWSRKSSASTSKAARDGWKKRIHIKKICASLMN